jgi:coenzyme F420-reducing hydrogenase alpha subunit
MGFPKFFIKKHPDGYTIYKSAPNFQRYKTTIITEVKSYSEAKKILDELLEGKEFIKEVYSLTHWLRINSNTVGLSETPQQSQIDYFNSLKGKAKSAKLVEYINLIEQALKVTKITKSELAIVIKRLLDGA